MAVATSTILAAATIAATAYAANEQRQAQADAEDAEKEARNIAGAEGKNQQREKTRQQIREERIRRAQIMQSAETSGVSGGSGVSGAVSGLQTSVASNIASMNRQGRSAQQISAQQQSAADSMGEASQWESIGSLAQSAGTFAGGLDMFNQPAAGDATQVTDRRRSTIRGGVGRAE